MRMKRFKIQIGDLIRSQESGKIYLVLEPKENKAFSLSDKCLVGGMNFKKTWDFSKDGVWVSESWD